MPSEVEVKLSTEKGLSHGAEPAKGADAVAHRAEEKTLARLGDIMWHWKQGGIDDEAVRHSMLSALDEFAAACCASPIKAEVTTAGAELRGDVSEYIKYIKLGNRPLSGDMVRDLLERCRDMLAAAESENASLRAKLAERDADAERLDWLESTKRRCERELGVSCGWYVDESGAPIVRGELEALWSKTLRAAIDAARQSAQAASQPSNPDSVLDGI